LPHKQTLKALNKMKKHFIAVTAALIFALPLTAFGAGNVSAGQDKSAVCHACHGADGMSTQPIYPNLGGQQQNYLTKALHDFQDGKRQDPVMSGFAANLSDTDIEDIAAWYASQQGLSEINDK
jgi:cytochrome c553